MSSISMRSVGIFYVAAAGALVAVNIKWRFLPSFLKKRAKKLPINNVEGSRKRPKIVLLHGMWHDASYFHDMQQYLQQHGYSSIAIDLLPGERLFPGFTQTEIVRDLEHTLADVDGDELVLVGHSQGGLVVQSLLKNGCAETRKRVRGIVLMGTFPLGMPIPFYQLVVKEPRNMFTHFGYLFLCLFGRLMSLAYLKHIFLLPTTDSSEMEDYTTKLLLAPPDGFITITHFPEKVGVISTKPTLMIGAENDIIYPPHLCRKEFESRFPNMTARIIPHQAHCFKDPLPKSNESAEDVLFGWLDAAL